MTASVASRLFIQAPATVPNHIYTYIKLLILQIKCDILVLSIFEYGVDMKILKKVIIFMLSVLMFSALFSCTNDNLSKHQIVFETRGGEQIATMSVKENELVSLPIPIRDDALFMGWFTSTTWEEKVENKLFLDSSIVLFARWASYQEIELTNNNYEQYLDISIGYTHTGKLLNNTTFDYCTVLCLPKDTLLQDGKEKNSADNAKSSIDIYVHNIILTGCIQGKIWRDTSNNIFNGFSELTVLEKQYGVPILNVDGILRGFILDL